MTPTILLKDGKLFMTIGAPGGSRISTAVARVIVNVIDFGMSNQDATDAPRVHHQWQPDRLSLERAISPDTVALLKARGYEVDYAAGVVLAQTAAIVSEGGWLRTSRFDSSNQVSTTVTPAEMCRHRPHA